MRTRNVKQAWADEQIERMKRLQGYPALWLYPPLGSLVYFSLVFVVMFVVVYDWPIWAGWSLLGVLYLAVFGSVFALLGLGIWQVLHG